MMHKAEVLRSVHVGGCAYGGKLESGVRTKVGSVNFALRGLGKRCLGESCLAEEMQQTTLYS
jgi:hypothetical protein